MVQSAQHFAKAEQSGYLMFIAPQHPNIPYPMETISAVKQAYLQDDGNHEQEGKSESFWMMSLSNDT